MSTTGVRFVRKLIVVDQKHRCDTKDALDALDGWKVPGNFPVKSNIPDWFSIRQTPQIPLTYEEIFPDHINEESNLEDHIESHKYAKEETCQSDVSSTSDKSSGDDSGSEGDASELEEPRYRFPLLESLCEFRNPCFEAT